jgi:Flp pilus assembly protein TadG
MLAVLIGIFQCGIIFSNYIQLTNAVGVGAQYLQTIRQTSTDPCKDTFTAITNAAPALNSSNITVTFTFNPTAAQVTAKTCSGDQSELTQGEAATVTATYPASLVVMGVNFFATGAKFSQTSTVYVY